MHTLAAPASTSGTPSNATPTPPTNSATISGNEFLGLLTAELKNQDPTNPMDPTQFVSQMVQFNSLEQLISINQELGPASPSSAGSGAGSGPASGSAPSSNPSTPSISSPTPSSVRN